MLVTDVYEFLRSYPQHVCWFHRVPSLFLAGSFGFVGYKFLKTLKTLLGGYKFPFSYRYPLGKWVVALFTHL